MPTISTRVKQTQASPFRKLADLANAAEARGTKIHYLNIGQPDIQTPPAALAHLRLLNDDIIAYAPAKGLSSYRQKLQAHYAKLGTSLALDHILVTSGASEAILLLMLACLEQGEEVIVPEPLYANYVGFSQMADVRIQPITSTIENGFELPKIEAFEAAITPKTKGIFICNPNNPTGCVYSETAIRELCALVKRHDLFLFV